MVTEGSDSVGVRSAAPGQSQSLPPEGGGSAGGDAPIQLPQSEAAVREVKTLFGDVGVEVVLWDDPRIPPGLRQRRRPSIARLIAIRCADGLSALLVSDLQLMTSFNREIQHCKTPW